MDQFLDPCGSRRWIYVDPLWILVNLLVDPVPVFGFQWIYLLILVDLFADLSGSVYGSWWIHCESIVDPFVDPCGSVC